MTMKLMYTIARQELTINMRNTWTVIFTVVFGLLVTGISYFGLMAEGFAGMDNFTRTSASILNLVLYIIPLVALTMGTLSFTGDKGATELLFSQPVSRREVYCGKLLGLFSSIAISILIGFTLSGILIILVTGTDGMLSYLSFVVLSLALAFIFLVLAVLISTLNRRKPRAFGIALFCWFFFVLFYDLLVLGFSLLLHGQTSNYFLFYSLIGNPVDLVRVASLILLDNATVFGPAGAALLRFTGGITSSIVILTSALLLWIAVPLHFSIRMLNHQDL